MKDFKNFIENDKNGQSAPQESAENAPEMPKLSDFKEEDVNFISGLTKKYANNKDKLIDDIVGLARKNKKEGKLNNAQLEEFEKKLKPMLNANQKKMLDEIMKIIK